MLLCRIFLGVGGIDGVAPNPWTYRLNPIAFEHPVSIMLFGCVNILLSVIFQHTPGGSVHVPVPHLSPPDFFFFFFCFRGPQIYPNFFKAFGCIFQHFVKIDFLLHLRHDATVLGFRMAPHVSTDFARHTHSSFPFVLCPGALLLTLLPSIYLLFVVVPFSALALLIRPVVRTKRESHLKSQRVSLSFSPMRLHLLTMLPVSTTL